MKPELEMSEKQVCGSRQKKKEKKLVFALVHPIKKEIHCPIFEARPI